MRVLALWYPEGDIGAPTQETMQKMGAFIQEATKAGVLLDTGGWNPDAPATVLTGKKGTVNINGVAGFSGTVLAPDRLIKVGQHVHMDGGIFGNRIVMNAATSVTHLPFTPLL